jgi:hypothetical protein
VDEAITCMELADGEKFNKKSKRMKFPHVDLNELWSKKENFTLTNREVPNRSRMEVVNQCKSLFLVPVVRQYITATADSLNQTARIVVNNLKLYKEFCSIYVSLKRHVRPLSVDSINVLHHSYHIFRYERASTTFRGLPHIDHHPEIV